MLRRKRKPLIGRSSSKARIYNPHSYEKADGGAEPPSEEVIFMGPIPMLPGAHEDMPFDEEEIKRAIFGHQNKQDDMLQGVAAIMRDIGLTRPNDIFMYDLHDALNFSYHIGERIDLESRHYLLELLDFINAVEVFNGPFGKNINGFEQDLETDLWGATNDDVKIMGHMGDGLYCPKCKSTFFKSEDILLAPNVSVATTTVNVTREQQDDVRVCKSHMTLVAICQHCYCSSMDAHDEEISRLNLSPIVMGMDNERDIIPLIPSCLDEKINTMSNVYSHLTNLLYWPKEYKDAICVKYQRDYEISEE